VVKEPAQFDVAVMTNMNGDILSDLASGLVGGLGFAASGNYGERVAIFEAVHGSAPKYAGLNKANPTALILSGVLMLRHLGEQAAAERVETALREIIAEGVRTTYDLGGESGTSQFADAIIERLGAPATAAEPSATTPGSAG